MDYNKLETLVNLKNSGEISAEEFLYEKERLRRDPGSAFGRGNNLNLEEYYFLMIMHLTQLGGLLIPFIGKLVPIVLWLRNKDHNPRVDLHGRIIFNWIFTVVVYVLIGFALSGIIVGLIMIGVIILLDIIFPLVATFKARKGIAWSYPMSIEFFHVRDKIAAMNMPPQPDMSFPPQTVYPPQE
jgi:uncharacterized Tic20 family protein